MRIKIIRGDITTLQVDAIVNAANSSLMGGGGVDGVIHRKGGSSILEACCAIVAKQGYCKTGEAVITTAGALPAKYVIHTVGPVWQGGQDQEPHLLSRCYLSSFRIAQIHQLKTLAFPNISTGVYGYPKQAAATTVFEVLTQLPLPQKAAFDEVHFVCFDEENFDIYQTHFQTLQTKTLHLLFEENSVGWGLRGDPLLWEAMKYLSQTVLLPSSEEALTALLYWLFELLAGKPITTVKDFYVEKYAQGGISSGYINTSHWQNAIIPALLAKFRIINT